MNSALVVGLLAVAAAISSWSYGTLQPAVTVACVAVIGPVLLSLRGDGAGSERYVYIRLVTAGCCAGAFSAVMANQFNDSSQLLGDAFVFFQFAIDQPERQEFSGLPLDQLRLVTEGSLAIAVWRQLYSLVLSLGLKPEPYIGLGLNAVTLGLTGVVCVKSLRLLGLADAPRVRRLTILACTNGLGWLMAGIHLRDIYAVFLITVLIWRWLKFLGTALTLTRALGFVAQNVAAGVALSYLRTEFSLMPVALATVAMIAGILRPVGVRSQNVRQRLKTIAVVVVLFGAVISSGSVPDLARASDDYDELAAIEDTGSSLGVKFVVNQSLPVRALLGSAYLLIFPIPIWAGLDQLSAYHWFKAANALWMWCVLPWLAIAANDVVKRHGEGAIAPMFILIVLAGGVVATSVTSLETRHFGAFLGSMLILAAIPEPGIRTTRQKYLSALVGSLCLAVSLHMTWFLLKLR